MMRRESGLVLRAFTTSAIWSMWPPSGVGQERHCTPYTGPRSPFGAAHSSQMVTPRSCSHLALLSPRRNHSSSRITALVNTFLVVTSGKPSRRSKRIWWPNTLRVPVPVRSVLLTPCANTWRMKSSYCERTGRVLGMRRILGRRRVGLGIRVELHRCQARVQPAAGHQLGMRAAVDDAAGLEHDDAVGALHGGQAMGDHESGAVLHCGFERGLHHALALGVERAGGLVEQQQ